MTLPFLAGFPIYLDRPALTAGHRTLIRNTMKIIIYLRLNRYHLHSLRC